MPLVNVNDPDRIVHRALRCLAGEVAPFVLLPGDPARAVRIGQEYLEGGRLMVSNREFTTMTGTYHGVPVSAISTGIGCPGAAMAMEDLAKLGVKVAIRVGTAGSIQPYVHPGDVVVATGAVREEGLTVHHVPAVYPAVAHRHVVGALERAAQAQGVTAHFGIIHTSDAFHSPKLTEHIAVYQPAHVLCFEMEGAAVLTLGALRGIRAGALFAIDGYVGNVAQGKLVPDVAARDQGIDRMIRIALAAIEYMAEAGEGE